MPSIGHHCAAGPYGCLRCAGEQRRQEAREALLEHAEWYEPADVAEGVLHLAPDCWQGIAGKGDLQDAFEYVSYLETELMARGGTLCREDHEHDQTPRCEVK